MERRKGRSSLPLLGRSNELEQLASWLKAGERLICVTGPPGIGKSALLRRLLEEPDFGRPRGVLVELEGCVDGNEARGRIDEALGADPSRSRALAEPVVLCLNDADGVWAELAHDVVTWLRTHEELQVVATSRQRAGIPEEWPLVVPPLEIESPQGEPAAVGLWVHERRRAESGYAVVSPVAREIVRVLEGVPLAIVLTAARARLEGDEAVLERLQEESDEIVPGTAAVEASWTTLSHAEQAVLSQCAVLHGPFTLRTAEAVVAPPEGEGVSATIDALVDKSLISLEHMGEGAVSLRILGHVRRHAISELDRTARDACEERLLTHLDRRVAKIPVFGASARDYRWCFEERRNLLGVARWALQSSDDERVAKGASFSCLEALVAQATAPIELIERALEHPSCASRDSLRAALLTASGERGIRGDSYAVGRERLEEGYELAMAIGEHALAARAASACLTAAARSGDRDDTEVWYGRIDAFDPEIVGEPSWLSARGRMATSALVCRNVEDARAEALRLLGHGGVADVPEARNRALFVIAMTDLESGRVAMARSPLKTALASSLELHLIDSAANLSWLLAKVEHASGHIDTALQGYRRTAELAADAQNLRVLGNAYAYEGLCLLERGDRIGARERIFDALPRLAEFAPSSHAFFEAVLYAEATIDAIDGAQAMPPPPTMPTYWLDEAFPLLSRFWQLAKVRSDVREGDERSVEALRADTLSVIRDALNRARSVEVRAIAHWLQRELDRLASEDDAPSLELEVASDGAWFRVDQTAPIDIRRRAAIRALLMALVRSHLDSPDRSLTSQDLVEVGWPGEKMAASAAKNRLRVALSRLRQLGLGGAVRVSADGWRLAPNVEAKLSK